MKRSKAVLYTVLVLLLIFCHPRVLAASNTYELDELKLQVSIPQEYYVITRDTPANDPAFTVCGTTKSEMNRLFIQNSIYLSAFAGNLQEEIVVTMADSSMTNFTSLGDAALEALISSTIEELSNYGMLCSSYEVYHHSQAKFVRLFFTDTAKTVHGLQYYTVYNGKAMNFTMRSYKGSLSATQKSTIQKVVDSILFDEAPSTFATEETPSFAYRDTDTGVEFTVPENWKREAFTKERENIDVKFVSTKVSGYAMIYGSADMWAEIPAAERVGLTRGEINDSYFSDAEIAAIYGLKSNAVFSKFYNGTHYYKMEIPVSVAQYGLDLEVTMTMLVHIENGWMYVFQFGGKSSDSMYGDFERLLKTVKYPQTASAPQTTVPSSQPSSSAAPDSLLFREMSPIPWIVLAVVAAAVIAVVIVIRRRTTEKDLPLYSDDEELPPLKLKTYCKNCGQELQKDSVFCHRCGTRKGE